MIAENFRWSIGCNGTFNLIRLWQQYALKSMRGTLLDHSLDNLADIVTAWHLIDRHATRIHETCTRISFHHLFLSIGKIFWMKLPNVTHTPWMTFLCMSFLLDKEQSPKWWPNSYNSHAISIRMMPTDSFTLQWQQNLLKHSNLLL